MSKLRTLAGEKFWAFLTRTQGKRLKQNQTAYANRRALGLIPCGQGTLCETDWKAKDVAKQLLYIENREQTCCIKLSSEKFLSRSALLILRGRLIGCLYGNKNSREQLFGEQARQSIFNDLRDPQTKISVYDLNEEFVLSTGAFFQGEMFTSAKFGNASLALNQAHHFMMNNKVAGVVTISDESNKGVVLCNYYHDGKVLGSYSYLDGWIRPNFDTAEKYLNKSASPLVYAAVINCEMDALLRYHSSSLSGLADRRVEDWRPQAIRFQHSGVRLIQFASMKIKPEVKLDQNKFLPKVGVLSGFDTRRSASAFAGNTFSLDPLILG